MTEIDTRSASIGELPQTLPAGTEPTLTISQLQGLLRDAAAYERAQRPIVLHGPQTPQTAVHPGIAVTYLPTSQAGPAGPARRLFTRIELVGYCGATATATGGAAGIALLIANSPIVCGIAALGGLAASLAAAVAGNHDDDRAQAAQMSARGIR